jgi:branched-chain amino acid transport system substrate-binding protein
MDRPKGFGDAVVIGMQFDRSDFSLEMDAARLAVIQVMENHGLHGRTVGLVECTNEESSLFDALSQDEANLEVSRYLADEIGVPVLIGPATSDRVDAAFLAVEGFGTMMISPTATSSALTHLDGLESTYEDPGLLWRTAPPDDLQGQVLAEIMDTGDVKTVAVINESGPYGTGLTIVFEEEFSALGGQTDQLAYDPDVATQLAGRIESAAGSNVDAVLFISATKDHTLQFLNSVGTDSRFDQKAIYLADGAHDLSLFESAALSDNDLLRILGTIAASADQDSGVYTTFSVAFELQFGRSAEETGYTPFAYDAAWLGLYGIAWADSQEGGVSGIGAARGMKRLSGGPEILIQKIAWNQVQAEFETGGSIDVKGASGELDYDDVTGETSAPIEVWSVRRDEDGDLEFVTEEIFED